MRIDLGVLGKVISRGSCHLVFVGGALSLCIASIVGADTKAFGSALFLPVTAIVVLLGIVGGAFRKVSWLTWCVWAMLSFAVYIIWRARWGGVEHLGWADILLVAAGALGYLCAGIFVSSQRSYLLWLYCILGLVLVNTGVGVYQFTVDASFFPLKVFGYIHPSTERLAYGFFGAGNNFAGFLNLVSFPLLAFALLYKFNALHRLMMGVGFLVCCIGMLLSTSRGGAVGMVVGIVFFLLSWVVSILIRRKSVRFLPLIVGGSLAVLVVSVGLFFSRGVLKEIVWDNLNLRPAMWKWALIQFSNAPVLGAGSRSYEYLERAYRVADDDWAWWSLADIDARFAHSEYLQLLAEYGIVGLLLGGGVVAVHFISGAMQLIEQKQKGGSLRWVMVAGALASMVAFGVHAFVEFNLHVGVNCLLFGMILGVVGSRYGDVCAKKSGKLMRGLIFVMVGVFCVSMVAICPVIARSWMLMEKGQVMQSEGKRLLALSAFSRSLEIWPKNYDSKVGRSYALFDLAESESSSALAKSWNDEAIRGLEEALIKYPRDIYVLNVLAQAYSIRGDVASAGQRFREAIGYAPATRFLRDSYVSHLLRYGKISEAIDQLLIYRTLRWSGRRYGEISRRIDGLQRQLDDDSI